MPKMFTEKDGKHSYSRIFGAVIISAFLTASVKVAWTTGVFPDIPTNWAMLTGVIYGANKFGKA